MKTRLLTILVTLLSFSVSKAQQTTDENKIYSFVSMKNPPKFPGGMPQLYKFLTENIKYPEQAKKENIQGTVFVSFTIEEDGSVNNVKTVRGLGFGTNEEAERVLKLSPKWEPGVLDNKAVRVSYNIPIKFSLNSLLTIRK
ncbi:energy transducer TonB [Pedobacter sp. UBA4863]|uniref:energy transducer TonB n=1 Tax=Pedobacter sp. UBA4863 TaxID=1947060 RepID=UPI0025DCFE8E|nr:energy transducer TonB [Pedobacter sp. UBA4863]